MLAGRLTRFAEPGRGRLRARPGSPRIALVGNCQVAALAQVMQILLPEAAIAYRSVYRITRAYPRPVDLAADLARFDFAFVATHNPPFSDGAAFEGIGQLVPVIPVPIVVFPAFHPDLVYVTRRNGAELVQGPLRYYHSALALAGHRLGLSAEATLRLFSDETFRVLGYHDLWDGSVAGLIEAGRACGLDFAEDVLRWTRRGAFMHSVNHPKMMVACDLARRLIARAGLHPAAVDAEALAADTLLREGAWPIYPEIGARYGIAGGYGFVRQPLRSGETLQAYALRGFVAASFTGYARAAPAALDCPRVDAWQASDATWSRLRALADG